MEPQNARRHQHSTRVGWGRRSWRNPCTCCRAPHEPCRCRTRSRRAHCGAMKGGMATAWPLSEYLHNLFKPWAICTTPYHENSDMSYGVVAHWLNT
ncbi:hypothetical protein BC826DRAFT_1079143 [Russula brevipes]|nr:hypothetical protein BC826DRAFT_1079143 [Russula brevipes]